MYKLNIKNSALLIFIIIGQMGYANTVYTQPLHSQMSWQQIKNHHVIKQDKDYSCGSASVATILTYFYHKPTSEQQIIDAIGHKKQMASLQDLKQAVIKQGFAARGLDGNLDTLQKLKIPAIVYLVKNGNEHFSVVRAVDGRYVYLADPLFGNLKLTYQQFDVLWRTQDDPVFYGRMLLILPKIQKAQR